VTSSRSCRVVRFSCATSGQTTFLPIGTLLWSYLSMIFDLLGDRELGADEHRIHVHGAGSLRGQLIDGHLRGAVRHRARMIIMLGVISLFFDMSLGNATRSSTGLISRICSISLV